MKHIRLVDPCSSRGVALVQRGRGAYCSSCDAVVHDLRRATRAQALALLEASGGRMCGITRRGADGQPAFAPEPRRTVGALRGAALAVALTACGADGDGESEPGRTMPAAVHAPEIATPPTPQSAAPPGEPPAAEAPPTTLEPAPAPPDTDASTVREHHREHRHRHAPVTVEEDVLVGGLEGL